MRRKVKYVEDEAGRAPVSLWGLVARGRMNIHDREQKPLGADLDDPRYGLEAIQGALFTLGEPWS